MYETIVKKYVIPYCASQKGLVTGFFSAEEKKSYSCFDVCTWMEGT